MRLITYKIPASNSNPLVAGKTFTGGKLIDGGKAVRFEQPVINGQRVAFKIDGKPDLAELVVAAAAPLVEGEASYRIAANTYSNAVAAYEAKSEHGYPVKEARAVETADTELKSVFDAYSQTKALHQILAYQNASNDAKREFGNTAMVTVETTADAISAAAVMVNAWSKYVHSLND
jgi:dihydroneopterin aldolase